LDFELFIQELIKLSKIDHTYYRFLSFRFFPFFLLFYYNGFFDRFKIKIEKGSNLKKIYVPYFDNTSLLSKKFFTYSTVKDKKYVGEGTIILDHSDPQSSYEKWRNERWDLFHINFINNKYFHYFSQGNVLKFDSDRLIQIIEQFISTPIFSEHGHVRAHSEREFSIVNVIDYLCDLLVNKKDYPKLEFRPVAKVGNRSIPSVFSFTFYDFSKDSNYLYTYLHSFDHSEASLAAIILALLLGFFKIEKV
jgi:hypothetical protein